MWWDLRVLCRHDERIPQILADDPIYGPKAQRLAERTYEFSQFLYRVLGSKMLAQRYMGKPLIIVLVI